MTPDQQAALAALEACAVAAPKYRAQQAQLFQPIAQGSIPPRLPGQLAQSLETHGPTSAFVDHSRGWQWENKGGDWIDADGMRQGSRPWASLNIVAAAGVEAAYSLEVAGMLNEAARHGTPCAFLLRGSSAIETSTRFGPSPPRLVVTLDDGSQQTLQLLFAGPAAASAPAQSQPTMKLPAFFEFSAPSGPAVNASLIFSATVKSATTSRTATLFLLSPDRSLPDPRQGGVDGGLLDASIMAVSSVIGAHRYADADTEDAYLFHDTRPSHEQNTAAEANYSPELFGGATDTSKYPYVGAGKWLNVQPNHRVVKGADIPHGPVAPGLGALRIEIRDDPQAVEGGYAPQAGFLASVLEMPLPADKLGLCDHLFVRQYFSWAPRDGEPDSLDLSELKAVYRGAGNTNPVWSSIGGKFGIVPTHNTVAGGFSGSAGAGDGWQMRLSWGFPLTGAPGPQSGGLQAGFHLYDFMSARHPLKKPSAGSTKPWGWGKVGGVLYARRWYCIETELKLNSVDQPGILPDGTPHLINGVQQFWSADGELRCWIDGMLAWEDTGLIFRTLPTRPRPAVWSGRSIYPIRELGVRSLLLNTYVGGTSPSTRPHMHYYAGLAYGTEYIGPMRGV